MLYIYDIEKLDLMKQELSNYNFLSISNIVQEYNDLSDIASASEYDTSVVDITSLVTDNSISRFFAERCLIAVYEASKETHFCMQSYLLETFKLKFPLIIDDNDIDFKYKVKSHGDEISRKGVHNLKPITLHVYDNQDLKDLSNKNTIISLSNLVEEYTGVSLRYNIKDIEDYLNENDLNYIDITSVIMLLKWQDYWTFQFEILLRQIIEIKNPSFTVEDNFEVDAMRLFPSIFNKTEKVGEKVPASATPEQSKLDIDDMISISESINSELKGHDDFKNDFRHNLLKFSFLKEMGQRKILSILVCGSSGVGKTEFAKITSNYMYPNEPLIKINFGNYSNEGVLNSLIGSPLGYVGSEEGGELINKISTSKSKVILIDEFEKATPSVYNFFYELLEDGQFTDRHGKVHSLDGYIIIFTSNMTENRYMEHIPDSLKSRIDMAYNFEDLSRDDKLSYIRNTVNDLVEMLNSTFNTNIDNSLDLELENLVEIKNLRDIKRKIEDIIFIKFFKDYKESS